MRSGPSLLDKLERSLGRFAIPGISLYLIIGQVFVVLASMAGLLNPQYLILVPQWVLEGQWWRVLTFIFEPAGFGPGLWGIVSLVFAWWIFYFMGTALEGEWGAFRYNLFLVFGYVLTVGLSFLFPFTPATYMFLAGAVFLAFARLNPHFEILVLYILPVQVRWLGLLTWIYYLYEFVTGGWPVRVEIAAAVATFVLFFGPEAWRSAGRRTRRTVMEAARPAPGATTRHRCRICGKTDLTDPQMDFRYCSQCADGSCYCTEHIFNHEHVRSANEDAGRGGRPGPQI